MKRRFCDGGRGNGFGSIYLDLAFELLRGTGVAHGLDAEGADFAADEEGQAEKLVSCERLERPIGEFVVYFALISSEAGQLLLMRSEEFFVEGFEIESAERSDVGMALAVPVHESAFGDAELIGDAAQAETLSAQFNELLFGAAGVHGDGDGILEWWNDGMME